MYEIYTCKVLQHMAFINDELALLRSPQNTLFFSGHILILLCANLPQCYCFRGMDYPEFSAPFPCKLELLSLKQNFSCIVQGMQLKLDLQQGIVRWAFVHFGTLAVLGDLSQYCSSAKQVEYLWFVPPIILRATQYHVSKLPIRSSCSCVLFSSSLLLTLCMLLIPSCSLRCKLSLPLPFPIVHFFDSSSSSSRSYDIEFQS